MKVYNGLTLEEVLELPTHRLLNVYRILRDNNWNNNDNEDSIEAIKVEMDSREHVFAKGRPTQTIQPKLLPISKRRQQRQAWSQEPKPDPVGPIADLESAVGKQVFKTSKKPFKSKNLYNTVSGITTNPHTKLQAFTFEEDDSIVDAHICELCEEQ